ACCARGHVGFFFFSSRRRHTRFSRDWSSDVCSSDLLPEGIYAIKELNERAARHEYAILRELEELAAPAVSAVGLVTGRTADRHRSEERRVGRERRARWSRWRGRTEKHGDRRERRRCK